MKAAGAKRALVLPVGGAFHSPLMLPAKEELAAAIEATKFHSPSCPVYQNVVAKPVTDPSQIKKNLIDQLTGAVRWTQIVAAMIEDGATHFTDRLQERLVVCQEHPLHDFALVGETFEHLKGVLWRRLFRAGGLNLTLRLGGDRLGRGGGTL